VGGGVVAVEVGIDGVLVLHALLVLGLDAVLVEEALEEEVLGRQADGLAGGLYAGLVEVMEIRGAAGTVLDHLHVRDSAAIKQKYLG